MCCKKGVQLSRNVLKTFVHEVLIGVARHGYMYTLPTAKYVLHNLWLPVDIQPSSHQVLKFWRWAADAAAFKYMFVLEL